MRAQTFECSSSWTRTMAALFTGSRPREVASGHSEVTILVPSMRNFPAGNLQPNELGIGAGRACMCRNKWFMTGSRAGLIGSVFVSTSAAQWTHADRSPKKPSIDLRHQQIVHVHGRDLPLIDCFIITSGRPKCLASARKQEVSVLMPSEQYCC